MKKLLLALLLLAVPRAHAQTNYIIGLTGAWEFDNRNVGVTGALEVPFLHHYELNLLDTYSPYENHVGLGIGHANIASVGFIGWVRPTFGFTANLEDSGYSVTQVSKTSVDVTGGLVKKAYVLGIPARLSLGYVREVNNGIIYGVESSHMNGAYFRVDSRLTCRPTLCLRLVEQFATGRVLKQGNPVCDGTYGSGNASEPYCPRAVSFGGGVSVSLVLDMHKSQDVDNLF